MFDAVLVQMVHKTPRSSRGFSRLKLLLGIVFHVPVFGAVVSVNHTKELSFGGSVADSATPFLQVTSAARVRHKVNFDRTTWSHRWLSCRGEVAGSKRQRSICGILFVHFRSVRIFRMLAMLRTFTHKGKQKNVFVITTDFAFEPAAYFLGFTNVWFLAHLVKGLKYLRWISFNNAWSLDLLSYKLPTYCLVVCCSWCTSRSRGFLKNFSFSATFVAFHLSPYNCYVIMPQFLHLVNR